MIKQPCVYILASKKHGRLYVGVTSNLVHRVWQHKNDYIEGVTKKYNVHILVYYAQYETMVSAITREKQMKKWNRNWKIRLIEENNPNWDDLWNSIH
ncbi:GIY-YIG nuclease family protein [Ghiorsea bivora]|uniref:GIY-YIG nuclease family protein n=1 Tax=Ghiorsea bivora TaxID=1485545 RepID=UPI00056E5F43|nr:GIY-YIG nuclease family protein [Ghiorsea bivora]